MRVVHGGLPTCVGLQKPLCQFQRDLKAFKTPSLLHLRHVRLHGGTCRAASTELKESTAGLRGGKEQQNPGGKSEPDEDRSKSELGSSTSESSVSTISTEEWRSRYEQDGTVDLWVEEEFNAGSRISGGSLAAKGMRPGTGSGEGPSRGNVPRHRIKIYNRQADQEVEVDVPEDRYVLFEAEDQGLLLPWACRMGCCTACAVRVKEGELYQPQSLGVSQELKDRGFALMCVSYPRSDAVLETVEEDEVYDLQFGQAFASQATNPRDRSSIERDDFALEIANMDE